MNKNIKYLVESFIDNEDEIIDVDINLTMNDKFINLGLPSGTLWAKCNLGADNPEDYGSYYQWGKSNEIQIEPQKLLKMGEDLSYYEKYDDSYKTLKQLKNEDDPAYINTKGLSRTPTQEQCKELIDNCKYKVMLLNRTHVIKFTSKINNKFIYIPLFNDYFALWCSSNNTEQIGDFPNAYAFVYEDGTLNIYDDYYCHVYCNIRPVIQIQK